MRYAITFTETVCKTYIFDAVGDDDAERIAEEAESRYLDGELDLYDEPQVKRGGTYAAGKATSEEIENGADLLECLGVTAL